MPYQTQLDITEDDGSWTVERQHREYRDRNRPVPKAWVPFARDMASHGVLVGFR